MKSLIDEKIIASMQVARTGINRVIFQTGETFANETERIHKGKYLLLLKRKGTKVIAYDNKGKKVEEINFSPGKKTKSSSDSKSDKGTKESSEDSQD